MAVKAPRVLQLELAVHGRADVHEYLRHAHGPAVAGAVHPRRIARRGQLAVVGMRAVHHGALRIQQVEPLVLLQPAQLYLRPALAHGVYEVRPVDEVVHGLLHAHQLYEPVPHAEPHHAAAEPHRYYAVEYLVRLRKPPLRLGLVMRDHRQAQLLYVVKRVYLPVIGVAHHTIARVGHGGVLVHAQAAAAVAYRLGHAYLVLNDHVGRHVAPPVQLAAQLALYAAPERVAHNAGETAVHIHLVPGYLVYHDHRPHHVQIVERAPQAALLLLHRQHGYLVQLSAQLAQHINIAFVHKQPPLTCRPARLTARRR